MHTLAVKVSFGAKRFWRNNQQLKSFLRGIYYKFNGQPVSKTDHDAEIKARINKMYEPYNKELAQYLKTKGITKLPNWLQ